ncbi:MAG: hypothetical protein AVDCRST_MAG06-2015, partial [uncultured Nocardioides sp.]
AEDGRRIDPAVPGLPRGRPDPGQRPARAAGLHPAQPPRGGRLLLLRLRAQPVEADGLLVRHDGRLEPHVGPGVRQAAGRARRHEGRQRAVARRRRVRRLRGVRHARAGRAAARRAGAARLPHRPAQAGRLHRPDRDARRGPGDRRDAARAARRGASAPQPVQARQPHRLLQRPHPPPGRGGLRQGHRGLRLHLRGL